MPATNDNASAIGSESTRPSPHALLDALDAWAQRIEHSLTDDV